MPTPILREEPLRLMREANAAMVEVLPASEFEEVHIARAVNIPFRKLDKETAASLDASRPVIVYCHDSL